MSNTIFGPPRDGAKMREIKAAARIFNEDRYSQIGKRLDEERFALYSSIYR